LNRRTALFRFCQIVAVFALGLVMLGADSSDSRYQRLGHMLICQCGDNSLLLECPHQYCPSAPEMKAALLEQLASGASDDAILKWFANKYGPVVLAAPVRGGFDNVAWIVPFALLLLATIGTGALVMYWKRRTTAAVPAGPQATADGDVLRDRVRRETEEL
jgi:cytochrome c-type biogenesis protein CcmH